MQQLLRKKYFIFIFLSFVSTQLLISMNTNEQTGLTRHKEFADCAYGKFISKNSCTVECQYNNTIYCRTHTFSPLVCLLGSIGATPNIPNFILSCGIAMCLDFQCGQNTIQEESQTRQYQAIHLNEVQVIGLTPQYIQR